MRTTSLDTMHPSPTISVWNSLQNICCSPSHFAQWKIQRPLLNVALPHHLGYRPSLEEQLSSCNGYVKTMQNNYVFDLYVCIIKIALCITSYFLNPGFLDLFKQPLCLAMELPAHIQVWDAGWRFYVDIKHHCVRKQLCQNSTAVQIHEHGGSGPVNLLPNPRLLLCWCHQKVLEWQKSRRHFPAEIKGQHCRTWWVYSDS